MTNFKRQLVAVAAASAVLLYAAAPVLADTTISITGNGEQSNNSTSVAQTNSTTVQQSNEANVTNNVNASADSGKNTAQGNTNGDVSISTGPATTNTTVKNTLNSNAAAVNCNCGTGSTTATISGNGEKSDNDLTLSKAQETNLVQSNDATVNNNVDSKANTGKNTAQSNTGGDVSITTGAASTTSNVSTTANANVAQVGGGAGAGSSSLSLGISGNGEQSDNSIELSSTNSTGVWQANSAYVSNDVDASAKSGDNNANGNTGGSVSVSTGAASSEVGVDNAVNFNAASVGCDCLTGGVSASVSNNGEDTYNTISAALGSELTVAQGGEDNGNSANLHNDVGSKAKTGDNTAQSNTGSSMGDPNSIMTGGSDSSTTVTNSGNENTYGSPITFPDFSFTMDWTSFFGMFGMGM